MPSQRLRQEAPAGVSGMEPGGSWDFFPMKVPGWFQKTGFPTLDGNNHELIIITKSHVVVYKWLTNHNRNMKQ